jgi:hypothetical protein
VTKKMVEIILCGGGDYFAWWWSLKEAVNDVYWSDIGGDGDGDGDGKQFWPSQSGKSRTLFLLSSQ